MANNNIDFHESTTQKQVFSGQLDRFKGVTVSSSEEPSISKEELSEIVRNSIEKWKSEVSRQGI